MFRRLGWVIGAVAGGVAGVSAAGRTQPTQTYIWGNGGSMAHAVLPHFRNYYPKLISTFVADRSLRLLRFGQHFEAGIDLKGNLLIWPPKRIDADTEQAEEDSREHIKILEKNVVDVRFTDSYVWALTSEGQVMQWPIDRVKDDVSVGSRKLVKPLQQIKQIATGSTA